MILQCYSLVCPSARGPQKYAHLLFSIRIPERSPIWERAAHLVFRAYLSCRLSMCACVCVRVCVCSYPIGFLGWEVGYDCNNF